MQYDDNSLIDVEDLVVDKFGTSDAEEMSDVVDIT
jgi:hypothetical protein